MKALILLALPLPVMAGDIDLLVDAWSFHSTGNWNEHNQTIGIEYTVEREGWHTILAGSRYKDSRSRDSVYVGAGMMYPLWEDRGWSAKAGGYLLYFWHDDQRGRWMYRAHLPRGSFDVYETIPEDRYFAPVPGFSLTYKDVGANIALIPPIHSDDPWTAVLQFKITL